jgi:gamma-glutamyltranspeptidase/glutathione hydrolase
MKTALGEKIVSTQNYIATHVGVKILEQGGNAFDAAIGISAVLSVVMPHTSGLGGDGFLLAKTPEGIIAYNASGWSPKRLNVERIPSVRDPSTVVIPGLVDLWDFVYRRYMTMDLSEVLRPAISLAANGFYVGRELAKVISKSNNMPRSWSEIFEGKRMGDILKLNELSGVLKIISKDPRDFYESKLTDEIVEGLNSQGVNVELSDFVDFRGKVVKPLKSSYRGYTLYELPPNSQGITTLESLKMAEIQETWKLRFDDPKRVKELVNIFILAYEDRNKFVTDPRFYYPEEDLLSEERLKRRLSSYSLSGMEMNTKDTTFFVVSDGENEVGFIQSLFFPFGSGITVKNIVFNNRGYGFTEGHNKPEPRKRPLHTLSILRAEKDDESLIIGCAGGDLRPQIHTQVLQYYVDYGLEIDDAVYYPRFAFLGDRIVHEKRINLPFQELDFFTNEVGVVQALKRKKDIYIGVADPRSEGIALPAN